MTVTSPPSGPRVLRRVLRARPRKTVIAAAAAILLMAAPLVSSPALAVPAGSAQVAPTPEPTADQPTGEAVFTLSPVGNGIVRAGEGLAVSVGMQNGTDAAFTSERCRDPYLPVRATSCNAR